MSAGVPSSGEQDGRAGDEVRARYEAVSNWGRWGSDDELGTLNFITSQVVRRSAAEVRSGRVVGCGDIDETPSALNRTPPLRHMIAAGDLAPTGLGMAADFLGIAPHGPATTHIDALCHIYFDARMYNGRPSSLVRSDGADANAISVMRDGVVTRGVLLDVPGARGVDFIEPSDRIGVGDLERAAELAGTQILPGDALIVRVGRLPRRGVYGIEGERTQSGALHIAGMDAECLPWLHGQEISLLASDGGSDALPSSAGRGRLPIHVGCIVFMGMPLIDNLHVEELLCACVEEGRSTFQFVVAPLTFGRATGSPVNPIAVF